MLYTEDFTTYVPLCQVFANQVTNRLSASARTLTVIDVLPAMAI